MEFERAGLTWARFRPVWFPKIRQPWIYLSLAYHRVAERVQIFAIRLAHLHPFALYEFVVPAVGYGNSEQQRSSGCDVGTQRRDAAWRRGEQHARDARRDHVAGHFGKEHRLIPRRSGFPA